MSSRQADELMLSLIIEDLSDTENESVIVEDDGGIEREIILNQVIRDPETGEVRVENDLSKIDVGIVLADTPSTPTFRNQQLNQMSDVMKSLPAQIQAMLLPLYIQATDLPQRNKMAKIIQKGLGLTEDDGNQDPEKKQMAEEIQKAQAMIQELQMKLEMKQPQAVTDAQVAKLMAEVDNLKAKSAETNVKALYSSVQAAGAVVQNPGIVPVADQISRSSGFIDRDGGQLIQPQQGIEQAPVQAIPASPEVMQQEPLSPVTGVAGGIETQRLTDN
jgi:predicted DNA-binding protein YlxM (UPF0122 family)